ncbi:VenA family class IV lanthipeptide [Streptomyces sp. NPDC091292]|uniref:VenA family class IV lanthipeptide n=1 Tax=Streptomyces sp. NPDC091292 TaxID=3365991 RepID=UPI003807F27B
MENLNLDLELLAELHALPETDPVDIGGAPFSGTCACTGLLTLLNTVCVGISCS